MDNPVINSILTRSSVRAYTDQPVSDSDIECLLKCAMASPTSVNKQPWDFIVIRDKDTLSKLAEALPYAKMAAHAQVAIVVCGNLEKALPGIESEFWIQDCSAASENILLAAHALGLGAVWTALYPEDDRVETTRRLLGIPADVIPLDLIPIGYPARAPHIIDKYHTANIHNEKW